MSHSSQRPLRQTVALCSAASVLASLFAAGPALAWKPKTHIYLAEEAMRDAVADGKVTIYETDYAAGRIVGALGEFEVDPKILAALRAAPNQFRAGVLGPDAYPDIVTGQTVIHPQEAAAIDSAANGSNAWLTHVWKEGFTNSASPQINAFAVGYLTHAAGDVFAHTYVNHYAGGEFMLTPDPTNAIKHLVLEGYIGKRTPVTVNAFPTSVRSGGSVCNDRKRDDLGLDPAGCGGGQTSKVFFNVTEADTSIDGVQGFIVSQMTVVAPGSVLASTLYKGSGVAKSIPFIFSTLRNGLASQVADYDRIRKGKSGPDYAAYVAFNGPAAEYKRAWIEDIDSGLAAWPKTSHELAKTLVYSENGADITKAKAIADLYVREHLASMMGAPDVVVMTAAAISDVISAIVPQAIKDAMGELMRAPVDFLIKSATGMTPAEWTDHFKNPETHFDKVMTGPGGGHDGDQPHAITLAQFNREQLKIADDAYGQPDLRWKINDIPAAFDTVQLTKLALLSPQGQTQLRSTLAAKGAAMPAVSSNLMLGWVTSLDHGNQWQGLDTPKGDTPKPAFAMNGGQAYQKLFLPVVGEKTWITNAPPPGQSSGGSVGGASSGGASSGGGWGGAGSLPPLPAPQPVPSAITIADLIGDWTSETADFHIVRTPQGATAAVTVKAKAAHKTVTIKLDETASGVTGEWFAPGETTKSATLKVLRRSDGAAVFNIITGMAFNGEVITYATRVAAPQAPAPAPRPSPAPAPAPAPPPGGGKDDDWLPSTPTPQQPDSGDWLPTTPAPRPPPPTGGGGSTQGAFQPLGPLWDVRFEGAQAYRGLEVHVTMTLKNVSSSDQYASPGSFMPKLKNADGETMMNRGVYRAQGEPAEHFTPLVSRGDTLRVRFVFTPAAGTAAPRSFILQADNSRPNESPVLSWDISNVKLTGSR